MNGVHDLGGTDGLGPVPIVQDEPVFRAEWEKTAFSLFAMSFRAGFFGVDQFRHGIEKMHPVTYLESPYYEHWLHSVEHYGVEKGVIDAAELDRRTEHYLQNPDEPMQATQDPDLLEFINAAVKHGAPASRASDAKPKFAVGDNVTVATDSPYGHTRRARYIRGRSGEIIMAHGTFIYPDTAGNGLGEDPQHVYTLQFTSQELWGPEVADPNGSVTFDVWEPYITLTNAQAAA